MGWSLSGAELDGDLAASGSDFGVLENTRWLALGAQVDQPRRLEMWGRAPEQTLKVAVLACAVVLE